MLRGEWGGVKLQREGKPLVGGQLLERTPSMGMLEREGRIGKGPEKEKGDIGAISRSTSRLEKNIAPFSSHLLPKDPGRGRF